MNTNHDALREALDAFDAMTSYVSEAYSVVTGIPTGLPEPLNRQVVEAMAGLHRALSQPMPEAAAQGWKPIETAPKDGSMFLCWVRAERWSSPDGECSSHAHDTSQMDFCWWRDGLDGNGYFDPACGQIGDSQDVILWAPLPAVPGSASPAAPEGAKPEIEWTAQDEAELDAAIQNHYGKSAQPPHPQPQAQGEPEVVLAMNSVGNTEAYLPGNQTTGFDTQLITLQSHREAIAQHRAALEECAGAMQHVKKGALSLPRFSGPELDAAIAHANQVLGRKEGGI